MIDELLPREVSSHAVREGDGQGLLFPEEAALVARASAARKREFAASRLCAHAALRGLGLAPEPILQGRSGEPLWPAEIVGSLTHCDGYRAACVARRRDVAAIGIDAEPDAALPPGVLGQVATAPERAWLREAPGGIHWDRVLFSAKESLYKAWFPLAHRWLGFEDAVVAIRPGEGTFEGRLLVAPPRGSGREVAGWPGRFLVRDGLVLTAVVVPEPG